jgi:NTP pyrophosphatase (non-canonical NTP hydrolase)
MTKEVDLKKYMKFVDGVTSPVSKDPELFIQRVNELEAQGLNVPRLLTASVGLSGEGGEFNEFAKKIVFHGKEYNEPNITAMKKELGDIIWYWTQACLAMGVDPNEIVANNVEKLEARYPGGKFSVFAAENRAEDDK